MDEEQTDVTTARAAVGAATAVLGGGVALSAAGTAIGDGTGLALQIAGVMLILVGAVLLGRAYKELKSAEESAPPV